MNKTKFYLFALSSSLLAGVFCGLNPNKAIFSNASVHGGNCHFNHYDEIKATYSDHGVREYYICCDHPSSGPVFTRPSEGYINDNTHDASFINTITKSDSRYIKPISEGIDFEEGYINSQINKTSNLSKFEIVSGEGIDNSNALLIENNSWNFSVGLSKYYLDQIFSNPSVNAISFYAKSSTTTNDFRRLSNGKGITYESNTTGYGITNEYKKFIYTREYYLKDLATDSFIYGGMPINSKIYIDNIKIDSNNLYNYGLEAGSIKESTSTSFKVYTGGHDSVNASEYIAPELAFYGLASDGVIASTSFDYTNKTEGHRSLKITKNNGYLALYLPQSIYRNISNDDYLAIDIYSTFDANANITSSNLCDGFTNTNYETLKKDTWTTYYINRGTNVTTDGRFMIIDGGTQGDIYIDNMRVINLTKDVQNYQNRHDIYVHSNDEFMNIPLNNPIKTIKYASLNGTTIIPENNKRYIRVANESFNIKTALVHDGDFNINIIYTDGNKEYNETIFATKSTIVSTVNASLTTQIGSNAYYSLSSNNFGGTVYRMVCEDKEVPYQIDGSNLSIAHGSLIELANYQSGTITVIAKTLNGDYEVIFNLTVSGSQITKPTIPEGKGIPMHFYSPGSSYANNTNYAQYHTPEKIVEYDNVGANLWYEQSLGVTANDSTLPESFNHLITLLKRFNKKLILVDRAFGDISRYESSIYGVNISSSGKTLYFANQSELDSYVENRMKMYLSNDTIFGLTVSDEPTYKMLKNGYGEIIRSIKRVLTKYGREDFLVNTCLLPMTADPVMLQGESGTQYDDNVYLNYLNAYLETTQNKYLQYDLYPFTSSDKGWIYEGKGINRYTIKNLLLAAEFAKEHNLEFRYVAQGITYYGSRILTNEDIQWITNMLMGFGIKRIGFFVYQCRPSTSTGSEVWLENSSCLNVDGERNDNYYMYQNALSQINAFAKVISGFDYEWSKLYKYFYGSSSSNNYADAKKYMDSKYATRYADFSSLSNNKDWTLVTGLVNKTDPNIHMYMVQNVYNNFGARAYQTETITFTQTFKYVLVYEGGLQRLINLNSNRLVIKLSEGHAAFIIPFN